MFKVSFSLLVFICACSSSPDKGSHERKNSASWQSLTIAFNDTIIRIVKSTDTLELVWAVEEDIHNYEISNNEKDSFFTLASRLLDYKKQPKRFCTDYVGKLMIRIVYNSQLLNEARFSSICDWREVDTNTERMSQLLKNIINPR